MYHQQKKLKILTDKGKVTGNVDFTFSNNLTKSKLENILFAN